MIKRADASKISREKATKEQIAENFKRLAVDTDKKVQLKPSLLKIQKTLDGNTFGIIHENKTYYLKYTTKKGSTNPADFKHLDGLNATFGIEKHNSFDKAINKMSFICEAQNNAHKLRLLLEKDEDIIDDTETSEPSASKEEPAKPEPTTTDTKEQGLIDALDTQKQETPPAEPAPAANMGGEEAPVDTQPKGNSPKDIADELLGPQGIGGPEGETKEAPAPEGDMGGEMPPAPEGEAPAEEPAPEEAPAEEPVDTATPPAPEAEESGDPKKEFQETVGKLGQVINDLQDKKLFDEKDVKNVINSAIAAVGKEGFEMVGPKVVDSFIKKMKGSQEKIDNEETPEETPEEAPIQEPAAEEEETQKLDEKFLMGLKTKAKLLLKEQLQQEIEKRKRNILIESIKRKII
jgi:hypothetical protein